MTEPIRDIRKAGLLIGRKSDRDLLDDATAEIAKLKQTLAERDRDLLWLRNGLDQLARGGR